MGEQFENPWLLDSQGQPTTDPAVLEHATPRGSLQLLGGQEYGHKGFGFALMIEALSQGLAGHGRLDAPKGWGGNTFLQIINPEFFAGSDAFADQTNFFGDACRRNKPIDAVHPVRLPGDQAAVLQAKALSEGLQYPASVWKDLSPYAEHYGVKLPTPLPSQLPTQLPI